VEHIIPPENIASASLSTLFFAVRQIVTKGGGTIPLTQMLTIINFPPEINERIKKARGPLLVKCYGAYCEATNTGKKIEENIPGAGGWLGIIVKEKFSCKMTLDWAKKILVVKDIKGLDADIPGPFNMDVDTITIRLPNHVKLEL